MCEKLYELRMEDPACPGFCSFSKSYIGTISDITQVVENMKQNNAWPEIVEGFQRFLAGDHEVTHHVCYRQEKLLSPVEVVDQGCVELEGFQWSHYNIFDFEYKMRASHVTVEYIIVKDGEWYCHYIRPIFTDLQHYDALLHQDWLPIGKRIWGNRAAIQIDEKQHIFLLFIKDAIGADLESFAGSQLTKRPVPKINFAPICEEIFGDG